MAEPRTKPNEIDAKFETLNKDIIETFDEIFHCLEKRKQELLSQLSAMRTKHDTNTQLDEAIKKLRLAKETLMKCPHLEEVIEPIKAGIEYNIRLREQNIVPGEDVSLMEFRCLSDQILRGIKETNLIELIPEYIGREKPILEKCPLGPGDSNLENARGVAIDRDTNEVYIADQSNNRIQVLTTNGDFIRGFHHEAMLAIHDICLSKNDVFLTDKRNYLLKFSKSGRFTKKTGSRGNAPGCFAAISGICFEKGSVYVSDSSIQMIQIFDSNLILSQVFGYGELTTPTAISFHSGKIYILSEDQNEIYCYSKTFQKIDIIHLTGQKVPMVAAEFFTIDSKGNFLVCESEYSEIRIFSPNGYLKQTLGKGYLHLLCGIALDDTNAIICVNFGTPYTKCFQKY